MAKHIRQSSPIFTKAGNLVDLAIQLPMNPELQKNAEALSSILDLPDKFNAAFVSQGWVYVEFCCGYESGAKALEMRMDGRSSEEIDTYLSENFLNIEPLYWQAKKMLGGGLAEPIHPVRANVVERAFHAYKESDFIVSIPLLLMLIDGFGIMKTGTKSIFSDLSDIGDLFESETSIGGHPSGLKAVLAHLVCAKKGYKEELLTMPLRNAILHGTRFNYGTKIVATKALCVFAAVVEWARDIAIAPKDEAARRDWNATFLTKNFAKLQSTSPDEALGLLQSAFDKSRHYEAVAVIDYDPIITNLHSKLSEWTDLMSTVRIQIVRKGDWEVFGAPTNTEQHARCRIELTVLQEDQDIDSRSDQTLYATRQAVMGELGLGNVWQIGLPILGIIRSKIVI
jgi:hypothetical protein